MPGYAEASYLRFQFVDHLVTGGWRRGGGKLVGKDLEVRHPAEAVAEVAVLLEATRRPHGVVAPTTQVIMPPFGVKIALVWVNDMATGNPVLLAGRRVIEFNPEVSGQSVSELIPDIRVYFIFVTLPQLQSQGYILPLQELTPLRG